MPEKKRPAFSTKPSGSAVVVMNASSAEMVSSPVMDRLMLPASQGSMLAASASSDSARLKPRVPAPIPAPGGSAKPVMRAWPGSCDVCA